MNTLACIDGFGEAIAVGVDARILTIPQWLVHDLPEEDVARLKRVEGTIMKVTEIDDQGYVWFGTDNVGRWFCLRPQEIQVVHS